MVMGSFKCRGSYAYFADGQLHDLEAWLKLGPLVHNNNGRNGSFLRGWLPHRGKAQMACNYQKKSGGTIDRVTTDSPYNEARCTGA